jgi:phytoene synthase
VEVNGAVLIDGMAMDLEYNRYPDFDTLQTYCHKVAGVVGLMSASSIHEATRFIEGFN